MSSLEKDMLSRARNTIRYDTPAVTIEIRVTPQVVSEPEERVHDCSLASFLNAFPEALALARQALFPDFFRPVWKYVGKLAIAEFDEARYRMDGPGCIAIDELLRDLHTAQVTRIRFEQFLVIEGQGLIAGKLEAFPMPDAVLDEFRCAQCRVATGSVMDRHCRSIVLCGDCATTIRKRGEGCPTCGQAPDFVTAHRS